MKTALLLALLFVCNVRAAEMRMSDLISLEERIQELAYQKNDSKTQELKPYNQIHNFTNHFVRHLIDQIYKGHVLNSYEIRVLSTSLEVYLKISSEYFELITELEPADDHFTNPSQDMKWVKSYTAFLQQYRQTYDLFYTSKVIRRVVSDLLKNQNSKIQQIVPLTKSILNRKRVDKLENLIERYINLNHTKDFSNIKSLELEKSVVYKTILSGKSLRKFHNKKYFEITIADAAYKVFEKVGGKLSQAFGAAVGPIEWREGHLYKNKAAEQELLKRLRPLDLILEKKSFKLTDYTIPGHWGHIAVWLGTKKQLQQIGMWNHPVIVPFHKRIEAGYSIYEVRRGGVKWDRLDRWMNIDEVGIVRHKKILTYSEAEYAEVYKKLFVQIGKRYDYSFDIMTSSTVICSEIISLSYGPVAWPYQKVAGRFTLQPNDFVALTFYKESPLEFVAYLKKALNRKKFKFHSNESFAKTVNFYKTSRSSSNYLEAKKVCKNIKEQIHHDRGAPKTKRKCEYEYKSHLYRPITDMFTS